MSVTVESYNTMVGDRARPQPRQREDIGAADARTAQDHGRKLSCAVRGCYASGSYCTFLAQVPAPRRPLEDFECKTPRREEVKATDRRCAWCFTTLGEFDVRGFCSSACLLEAR